MGLTDRSTLWFFGDWFEHYDEGAVVRLNPATGDVVSTIKVGGHPSGIAVGANRVWVTVS